VPLRGIFLFDLAGVLRGHEGFRPLVEGFWRKFDDRYIGSASPSTREIKCSSRPPSGAVESRAARRRAGTSGPYGPCWTAGLFAGRDSRTGRRPSKPWTSASRRCPSSTSSLCGGSMRTGCSTEIRTGTSTSSPLRTSSTSIRLRQSNPVLVAAVLRSRRPCEAALNCSTRGVTRLTSCSTAGTPSWPPSAFAPVFWERGRTRPGGGPYLDLPRREDCVL
jgi:hypothetical protein